MPSTHTVIYLTTDQYAEVKAKAGAMPLSAWIKSQILGSRPERVKALLRESNDGELEAVLGAIQEVMGEKTK